MAKPARRHASSDVTLEEYIDMLKGHDWTFQFSDDHRVYKLGLEAEGELFAAQRKLDPDFTIWNTHAPKEYQIDRSHHQPD